MLRKDQYIENYHCNKVPHMPSQWQHVTNVEGLSSNMTLLYHYWFKSTYKFLSASSNKAFTFRDSFFLSTDFHELWHSMMSACLFTEVKQQWAALVLGWVTVSVHLSCL